MILCCYSNIVDDYNSNDDNDDEVDKNTKNELSFFKWQNADQHSLSKKVYLIDKSSKHIQKNHYLDV
jgi:hypothetical protein